MFDITDLILLASNQEPQDKSIETISQEDAKKILLHLVPNSFVKTIDSLINNNNYNAVELILNEVLSHFNNEIDLSIQFPIVLIDKDKIQIEIWFIREDNRDTDYETFTYSPKSFQEKYTIKNS